MIGNGGRRVIAEYLLKDEAIAEHVPTCKFDGSVRLRSYCLLPNTYLTTAAYLQETLLSPKVAVNIIIGP